MIIHEEIREALAARKPVVALESTLITHGLPYPANLETARNLERAIRDEGAIPATIAVIQGVPKIGLDEKELAALATGKNVRKCSRRDLPVVLAERGDGATTVATTMFLAHRAGVRVFATGGIGGVHRGHPFDISADLAELSRTPMTVVCAGAKAILDLDATREVLETKGVTVVGYQTDDFPAFTSRSSGLPVDIRCDTPEAVSEIIRRRDQLGLTAAILVTVPVPAEVEVPPDEAETAIARALAEADAAGIRGREVTPFLLAQLSELTGDRSRIANLALLEQNARVAAHIARALASG